MIRNRYEHPNMTGVTLNYNRNMAVKDGLAYRSTGSESAWINFVPSSILDSVAGMVHVMHATGTFAYAPGPWQNLLTRDDWIATLITNGQAQSLWISNGNSVTIDRMALYTPDDWQRVLAMWEQGLLDGPWFDGSLRPA